MVRKGYLEGNKDTTLRGHDEWVRVSWDKAFELVSGELKRVRDAPVRVAFLPALTVGTAQEHYTPAAPYYNVI